MRLVWLGGRGYGRFVASAGAGGGKRIMRSTLASVGSSRLRLFWPVLVAGGLRRRGLSLGIGDRLALPKVRSPKEGCKTYAEVNDTEKKDTLPGVLIEVFANGKARLPKALATMGLLYPPIRVGPRLAAEAANAVPTGAEPSVARSPR